MRRLITAIALVLLYIIIMYFTRYLRGDNAALFFALSIIISNTTLNLFKK